MFKEKVGSAGPDPAADADGDGDGKCYRPHSVNANGRFCL